MCGVTGVLDVGHGSDDLAGIVQSMTATLRHRGPDGEGYWVDHASAVALGHRRLAILDLSEHGAQPMTSASGRYVLSYNGELYNFRQLRRELESSGVRFRGLSDTEVLLEAIQRWGVHGALSRSNGMFAFGLWDMARRELHLCRDRLGEKPLYYAWLGTSFVFASELKALRAHPAFTGRVSREALTLLLRHGYIPAPYSIHDGIYKLPPASLLTVSATGPVGQGEPQPYWSLREVALRGAADPIDVSPDEAADLLEASLRDAVRIRLEADVPLGAFLSGGVDSSLVAALAQAESDRSVSTFTMGMDDARLDEADHARAVASHLGTDHHEVRCTPDDALALVPRLPEMYDEPFADPSQLPTALISAVARRAVTVCLSGDGGDEVFAGYNRYVLGQQAWRWMRRTPPGARRAAARLLLAASPEAWDRVAEWLHPALPDGARQRSYGTKAHKLAMLLPAASEHEVYLRLISQWDAPADIVPRTGEPTTVVTDPALWPNLPDATAQMLFLDGVTTLPDDMLVKVDRASMAVSLETRLPLLDHRVVELAWRLPMHLKIRDGRGKHVLRQVLHRYVPRNLVERPKTGFDPPLGAWLRGPLRPWAEDMLDPHRIDDDGFLHAGLVRQRWDEHLSGRRDWDYALWAVLMFQAWLASARAEVMV
jgi:asparagine synthase (glutamine-hydrolysing)